MKWGEVDVLFALSLEATGLFLTDKHITAGAKLWSYKDNTPIKALTLDKYAGGVSNASCTTTFCPLAAIGFGIIEDLMPPFALPLLRKPLMFVSQRLARRPRCSQNIIRVASTGAAKAVRYRN